MQLEAKIATLVGDSLLNMKWSSSITREYGVSSLSASCCETLRKMGTIFASILEIVREYVHLSPLKTWRLLFLNGMHQMKKDINIVFWPPRRDRLVLKRSSGWIPSFLMSPEFPAEKCGWLSCAVHLWTRPCRKLWLTHISCQRCLLAELVGRFYYLLSSGLYCWSHQSSLTYSGWVGSESIHISPGILCRSETSAVVWVHPAALRTQIQSPTVWSQ